MPQPTTPRTGTQQLPVQTRAAQIIPGTFSEVDNTVEVVFSAGARVMRHDCWNDTRYEEELEISPAAIDLSRIDAGVVHVLDNHDQYAGVAGVLGVATRAWVANGEARATLLLSKDPAKAGVVADIKGGVIRAVSVGYSVQRYEITLASDRTDGAVDLWRATRWMPQEISFVTIPADPAAATRSAPDATRAAAPCEFVTRGTPAAGPVSVFSTTTTTRKDGSMPTPVQSTANQPSADNAGTAPVTSIAPAAPVETAPAVDNVAQRAADISALCTRHAVPALAAELIRSGSDMQHAKDTILNAIALRDAAAGGHQNTTVQTVTDETDVRMRGMEDALLSRLVPGHKMDDNARQFRHLSLLELGREHLERNGVSTRGMDKMKIAGQMLQVRAAGMHGTSDFGFLFSNVASRRLSTAYADYPGTYQQWARQAPSLSDFKPMSVISMGAGPGLLKVNEHGEYKYGTFGDSAEQYQLATYGRIVAMTRQAIINDDLRSFDRLIAGFGTKARLLENQLVYEQLTGAAKMGDGKVLFHADHGNLMTGAPSALSLEALQAGRTKMRTQKSMDGDVINITPKFLIVPSALETLACQLTSNAYTPSAPGQVNDFRTGGRTALEVIVEPLLDASSATAWYLGAENALIDTVEYAYLDGANGPVTETREGFEVDGTEVKCRLDFVAKALDWRGLVKANGA